MIVLTLLGLGVMIFLNLVIPLLIFLSGNTSTISIVVTPTFAYVILHMLIYVLQFVFASLALSERFKLMNQYLG